MTAFCGGPMILRRSARTPSKTRSAREWWTIGWITRSLASRTCDVLALRAAQECRPYISGVRTGNSPSHFVAYHVLMLRRLLLFLTLLIGVALALALAAWLAVSFVLSAQTDRREAVMKAVNEQVGLDLGDPYSDEEPELRLHAVADDSAAAQAGLRAGDVIRWRSADTLYHRLIERPGGMLLVPVCRAGQPREVIIRVPALTLPAGSAGLLWSDWLDRTPLGCSGVK